MPQESSNANLYDLALDLIKCVGKYAWAVGLRDNLEDDSTRHKVEPTLQSYFHGDIEKLNSSIGARKGRCYTAIKRFNFFCGKHGIILVSNKDRLIELLLDPHRRQAWNRYIKQHEKAGTTFSLQDLERKYQKSR